MNWIKRLHRKLTGKRVAHAEVQVPITGGLTHEEAMQRAVFIIGFGLKELGTPIECGNVDHHVHETEDGPVVHSIWTYGPKDLEHAR